MQSWNSDFNKYTKHNIHFRQSKNDLMMNYNIKYFFTSKNVELKLSIE